MKSRVLNLYRSISLLIGVPFIVAESAEFTPTLHHPNIAGITLFAENPYLADAAGIALSIDGKRDSRFAGLPPPRRIAINFP